MNTLLIILREFTYGALPERYVQHCSPERVNTQVQRVEENQESARPGLLLASRTFTLQCMQSTCACYRDLDAV